MIQVLIYLAIISSTLAPLAQERNLIAESPCERVSLPFLRP
jgi:hypothetical protein